mmetsp:Transcript_19661/g.38899  ORF Transcript_19661/g.38899 Transcript_19661/m.38899 type:complete len:158 (+) Transcript_19661:1088-1561(+)
MALSGTNLLVGSMYNVYSYILPASKSAEVDQVNGETSLSTGTNPESQSAETNPTTATTDDAQSQSQTQASLAAEPMLDGDVGAKPTSTEQTGKNDDDAPSNLNPNADLNMNTNENLSPNSDPILQNLDNGPDTASVNHSKLAIILGISSLFMNWLCA